MLVRYKQGRVLQLAAANSFHSIRSPTSGLLSNEIMLSLTMDTLNCSPMRLMDLLYKLDTRLAVWQRANIFQWLLEVLQQKYPIDQGCIFPIDGNTKHNTLKNTLDQEIQ